MLQGAQYEWKSFSAPMVAVPSYSCPHPSWKGDNIAAGLNIPFDLLPFREEQSLISKLEMQ